MADTPTPLTTAPEGDTIVREEIDPRLSDGDGDHDRFAHYVKKADATRAAIEGTAVIALCGKKWVPVRDPERYPVCPSCKEIYSSLAK